MNNNAIKCEWCGKFIGYKEIEEGLATNHFEPSSDRGPEIDWWTCRKCNEND